MNDKFVNTQEVDGKLYSLINDYVVDNHAADGWAMYAYGVDSQNNMHKMIVRVPDDLREAIDSGDAELDHIDYSSPEIIQCGYYYN